MAKRAKSKAEPETCGSCAHSNDIKTALICYRFPPVPVVIDNKPQNMRCAVQANERACGLYKRQFKR